MAKVKIQGLGYPASIQYLYCLLLAVTVPLGLFLWQGHYGLNLADEGFLWYGAQRVRQGDVPIRDFMAYDPGRYYWSALFMQLENSSGILALRHSLAVFQTLGLAVALNLISGNSYKRESGVSKALILTIASIVLGFWMFPDYKQFDIALSIFLVGALTFLIQSPTYYRYFWTGVAIGLIAFFGRNHGLYGTVASFGVTVYLSLTRRSWVHFSKACLAGVIGIVNGYLPLSIMLATISGFAPAFAESIRFILFELKSTNLPLPVPWPWEVPLTELPWFDGLVRVLVGFFFLAVALYGVFGLAWVMWQGFKNRTAVSPVGIAAAFLALPYAHYAFSRADFEHLALGIFPFLIACFEALDRQSGKVKWSCIVLLTITSLVAAVPHHIGWQLGGPCRVGQCIETNVAGDQIMLHQATAGQVNLLESLADKFAAGAPSELDGTKRTFIAAPFWPGAYALLERKSPMWSIYPLFPRNEAFQKSEIERIKAAKPGFAIVMDQPLDGRDELRFSKTNPLIYQYIRTTLEPIGDQTQSSPYQLFQGK
jgi:hypothetical protein